MKEGPRVAVVQRTDGKTMLPREALLCSRSSNNFAKLSSPNHGPFDIPDSLRDYIAKFAKVYKIYFFEDRPTETQNLLSLNLASKGILARSMWLARSKKFLVHKTFT